MNKQLFSPYRICPIGAHIDHQGGPVLGRTLDIGTTVEYEPLDSKKIVIRSNHFGEANFHPGDLDRDHWSRYAQAAARVLPGLKRGLLIHVYGTLVGSGLSSSASVGLAYLKALADVNEIELTDEQLVQLEYRLEHDELNLQIGLLDPLTIVFGKKDALLYMDTIIASVTPVHDPAPPDFAWIVAYSGVSRELTKSGFNGRVDECLQAAASLKDGANKLSDIPPGMFEEKKGTLPVPLRNRATHFFGEVERVQQGAAAWKAGNLEFFGRLMDRSCESSINNYESGSRILVELHELVSSTKGVYGSRFSGGGYGGCVVALADREPAEAACAEIMENFSARHPDLPPKVFVAETGDGLSLLRRGAELGVRE